MEMLLSTVPSMLAYFYFNWRYFALVTASLALPRLRTGQVVVAYAINYVCFYLCTMLGFNLIVNWAVFFLFLLVETLLYCGRGRGESALYFALTGILCGVTINIFCRCAVAIAINQPLADFDNHVTSGSNVKSLPVFAGFLVGGLVLHFLSRPKQAARIQVLISHPEHFPFQLELMGGMFVYLFLNLLLYQDQDNGLLLKLWGVKSCLFAVVGALLAMRYSLKMCQLTDYREQNSIIALELQTKAQEEQDLSDMAYHDALTGIYNRQCAKEAVVELLRAEAEFVLCFVDLDNLKLINDDYGHAEGDRYIIAVAQELQHICRKDCDRLFRYGGDEFMIIFQDSPLATVSQRIPLVNQRLQDKCSADGLPYLMSISWGAAHSASAPTAQALIAAADEKMYQQKQSKMHRS